MRRTELPALILLSVMVLALAGCGRTAAPSTSAKSDHPGLATPPFPADRLLATAHTSIPGAATTDRSSGAVGNIDSLTITAVDRGEFALYAFHPANVPDQIAVTVDQGQTSAYWLALANYASQRWELRGPFTANASCQLGGDYLSPLGNSTVAVLVAPHEHAIVMGLSFVAENGPPTAAIQALPDNGPAPLIVNFDASSSSDPEGSIVNYEWEYAAGAGFTSTGSTPQFQHAYAVVGSYTATVRITDGADQQDTASVTIGVGLPNMPPTASLTLPAHQTAPYMAQLDGSLSSDSDGTLVKYEWDLDGNGSFETDTGTTASVDFNVPAPGLYPVGLRVTDNNGAVDTALGNVGGAGWINFVIPAAGPLGSQSALAVVNGHPAVAVSAGDGTGGAPFELQYLTAQTTLGTAPGEWNQAIGIAAGEVQKVDLRLINGQPVITSITGALGSDLFYSAASTADGGQPADWTTVPVESAVGAIWPASLAAVQGHPALAYCSGNNHLHYVRSASATGLAAGDWAGVVDIDGGAYSVQEGCSLAVISGNPAIVYNNITDIRLLYARSTTATGEAAGDWSQRVVLTAPALGYGGWLLEIEGHPAVAYLAGFSPYLMFGWATTPDGANGADWQQFRICAGSADAGTSAHMELVAGRPTIANFSSAFDVLLTEASTTNGAQASDWPATCTTLAASDEAYSPMGLADVGGHVAITYHDGVAQGLRYALRFD